ncbi:MAG: hypothetical protein CSB49_05230 [Proteobacteria bacterium]|nr:MAG: hypothetical protein CSB49_05230 [Pseudomonadota bacterium]
MASLLGLLASTLGGPSLAAPALVPGVRTSGKPVSSGSWVRYSFYRPGQPVALVRMAALERVGKAQWFEVSLTLRRGQTLVFKSLVEGDLGQPRRVLKMIVRAPGQVPMLLPEALARKRLPRLETQSPGTLVGKGPLRVPAGRFAAMHYRRTKGQKGQKRQTVEDLWLSKAIPGWPLLRYRAAGVRVELVAWGQGAQSAITRQPVKLDPRLIRGMK